MNIHQRVRAAIAKRETAAKRQADRAHDARFARLERAELKREQRIDDLISGKVEPRTSGELELLMLADGDFCI